MIRSRVCQNKKSEQLQQIPYFCQWESASMAEAIILGKSTLADDPLWRNSGALTQDDYIKWANHICGMACLKMLLAKNLNRIVPTLLLAQQATRYGCYVVEKGEINGLIYAPFVQYIRDEFGLVGRIETNKKAHDIPELIKRGESFMASVHPSIRWPEQTPPKKGGHLVLVTATDHQGIIFHNPSGHMPCAQENVRLTFDSFDRFFAGRGILVEPRTLDDLHPRPL